MEAVRALPKVLLHDHLDGGLRPATIIELAEQIGHPLPTTVPDELGAWFVDSCTSGSLERYLETFVHTVAVMQSRANLARVAREAVLDLASDGVVLAELRYAPEQHQAGGLSLEQVVEAVQAGIDEGVQDSGGRIVVGQLLCAMRQADRATEIARVALAYRDRGVVGFDYAGPEAGFPPSRAAQAFALLREADLPCTVHAGEADGPSSIAAALHVAGACRIGHGVAIASQVGPDGPTSPLAHWLRDRRIALELCPSSNLQTGGAASIAEHPVTALHRLGFAVTVNTDNRLHSGTSASRELALLVDEAGWTWQDVQDVTVTAARAAFAHHDVREALVVDVIVPAFAGPTGGRHRA
ncbi:MAG: adenosine deaminase [Cellulomonas sp.]|nr:adenosine deaminase [Actinomycetota bacterium]MCG2797337.1 adenosine deaminase [Cellulomonas sp.]